MAGTKTYAGAVLSAVLQGLTTGTWVMAGALPRWERRAVRAGIVAGSISVAAVQVRREQPAGPRLLDSPILVKDVLAREVPEQAKVGRKLPPRATLVALAVSTGLAVGGRRLEKRWLARLIRDGHARPYRSLGIRMGLLVAGTTLASDLFAVAEARRAERGRARPAGGGSEPG
jgi:hypothetical protein